MNDTFSAFFYLRASLYPQLTDHLLLLPSQPRHPLHKVMIMSPSPSRSFSHLSICCSSEITHISCPCIFYSITICSGYIPSVILFIHLSLSLPASCRNLPLVLLPSKLCVLALILIYKHGFSCYHRQALVDLTLKTLRKLEEGFAETDRSESCRDLRTSIIANERCPFDQPTTAPLLAHTQSPNPRSVQPPPSPMTTRP